MKPIILLVSLGVSVLCLDATSAMSQDRLIGKLSLTPVSGNCPATLAQGGEAVPVNMLLPEAGPQAVHVVQNRFRFNYRDPLPVAHPVTITGQIADYGVTGCTVAFRGQGVSYD